MLLGTAHITNTFIDLSEYCHDEDKHSTKYNAGQIKEQTPKQKSKPKKKKKKFGYFVFGKS